MSSKQVLIISNPQDEHTDRVTEAIRALGANPILFYPENLGKDLFLEISQSDYEYTPSLMLSNASGLIIRPDEIYSVWYRRPRLVDFEEGTITPEGLEFARNEWKAALDAFYALLDKILWVSHPDILQNAARKPVQLQLAKRLGLKVPRTLITNEAGKVKAFYELCNGKVIMKATGNGWVYSQDGEDVYFVLTNRASLRDIEAIDEISTAPVTFQEEIPKEYEIRANVVGQQVFAIRIDSQKSEVSELDWRRYDVGKTPYTPYHLPPEVENNCLKLAKFLGLEFGAIDLIRQPNGEYVFLEINGNGQFLWAEELSGVNISYALASLLSGYCPPLKSANL